MTPEAPHDDGWTKGDGREEENSREPLRPPSGGDDYQNCPECGCPHSMGVGVCSYCGAGLTNRVTFAEKARKRMETARWRYKFASKSKSPGALAKQAAKDFFAILFGTFLLVVGVWLLAEGGHSQSFGNVMIGLLLMLYGGFAVYKTVKQE